MSPGKGASRKDRAAAAPGAGLPTRYRGARARFLRPATLPSASQHLMCGPACWLPELIGLNEDLRRLFLPAMSRATISTGERIRDAVAAHYGLTRVELIGAHSLRRVARPRQVAMYICARHAGLPSRTIAALFGNRDLSTVHFAVRAVAKRKQRNPALADEIAALTAECGLGETS